ncbi:MAG TPA: glycosyltransferase family 39 protein [Anaerolineaceae bacterium]
MPASSSFFNRSKTFLWATLAAILIVGLVVRFYDLKDAPLDFHSTRQMHSVLIARGMYYASLSSAPSWQRELAVHQWQNEGLIEPQVMERITALSYVLAGREYLWLARIWSILFWLLGAAALALLAKMIAGWDAAVIAWLYLLVLPYGALASRSFQPDPLLTALISAALWRSTCWLKQPTWKNALLAGITAGLAIYIKSVAVFFVGSALAAAVLTWKKPQALLRDRQVWLVAALAVMPYILFHLYGVYIDGRLEGQFALRFFPQLWLDPAFYLRWAGMIDSTAGFSLFLAAVIGFLLIPEKNHRALLLGALVGYVLYGFALPFHTITHDYYQLPLLPLVALGLGMAAAVVFAKIRAGRWVAVPVILSVLLVYMGIRGWDTRVTLKRQDFSQEVKFWQTLGNQIGHDKRVVGLMQDYGYRLAYWGWVDTAAWMSGSDFNLRALAGQTQDLKALFLDAVKDRDYFVITVFGELEDQPELKKMLGENFSIAAETSDYLLYDLKKPLEKR